MHAAHVLGLSDRGRVAAGYRADLVLLDAHDWRHLAYHLAGDIVRTVISGGRVAFARRRRCFWFAMRRLCPREGDPTSTDHGPHEVAREVVGQVPPVARVEEHEVGAVAGGDAAAVR